MAAVLLAGLLAGCNVTDQYHQEYDDLGKKIVADWKQLPEVVDAKYDYRHGLDVGQSIGLYAAIRMGSDSPAVVEKMVEIARRDYWESTASPTMGAGIYTADKLFDGPVKDTSIIRYNGQIKVEDDPEVAAALEKKYGPRPTKK
ncbi:hypothetical protein [Lentzea sp. NBRC 105346]|uniref:hypothetical protein n=1 Tax=Lentzea sp. NBRC 105346 TaxID=3032205 RepID=UPI00255465BE|nr:hypothetical protein [Lentzea sp. NBRC 105346]